MKDVAMRDGFMLMDKNRYNQILSSLRGFEVTKREAQDDENVWLQQGNVLRNLWELEKLMFQNSILVLFNKKNGLLTYNNKLVSSKADNVESNAVTDRKSGNEGLVADCVSCSQCSILFGMRLRVKGETDLQNMEKLLQTLPLKKATPILCLPVIFLHWTKDMGN